MTTPRFDRLNEWANFLDDLPHDGFHMPEWGSEDWTEDSCGTAGCAAGWAVNRFHEQGLKLKLGSGSKLPCLIYGGRVGSGAISEFFGIPYEEVFHITMQFISYMGEYNVDSSADITPRHAADRIRKVIVKLGGIVVTDYPIKERENDNAKVRQTQQVG